VQPDFETGPLIEKDTGFMLNVNNMSLFSSACSHQLVLDQLVLDQLVLDQLVLDQLVLDQFVIESCSS
jgi:hypothetical protein